MPLTLPDTTPTERKKPPRRSWRHLPASPPVADPLPTPDPTQVIPGQVATGGDSDAVDLDPTAPSPKRRRRGWIVAVAVLLVAALVGGTVLALRDDSEPTAASLPSSTTVPGSSDPSGGTGSGSSAGNGAGNGSVQDVVRRFLEIAGHRVTAASSGEQAMDLLSNGRPCDLIILDLMMPREESATTFQRLRQRRPGVPVLLCTGLPQADPAPHLLQAGAVGLLRKPFRMNELWYAVSQALAEEGEPE